MTDFVVVDTSLAIKWVLREIQSEEALSLADSWSRAGIVPAAPALLFTEATNVLHRRVVAQHMSLTDACELLTQLLDMRIEIRGYPEIYLRALELANELHAPAATMSIFSPWLNSWNVTCGPPTRGSSTQSREKSPRSGYWGEWARPETLSGIDRKW